MSNKILDGKVALITGASRGIGAAIAKRFAAEGAIVALVARTLEESDGRDGSLRETASAIKALGGECHTIQADLSDPEGRTEIVDEVVGRFRKIDILVNNAAWLQFKHITQVPHKHLNLGFEINLGAPHDLSRGAFEHMKSQGAGWIVNISSATADNPPPAPYDMNDRYTSFNKDGGTTIYGATKAALDRLTTGWAVEVAGSGIAVNSLAPVAAVATEGALAVGGWDKGDHMEPQETMAEAALQLSHRSPENLTGRIVRSIPLLKELKIATKSLDGETALPDFDYSDS